MSCFIISEIGINHNGDLDLAKKMIDESAAAGADAVKFQKRDISLVYSEELLNSKRESPWGTTQRDQKQGLEFNKNSYLEIDKHCKNKNIKWFASAWDLNSLKFLEQFDLQHNKIASAMIVYKDLLESSVGKYIDYFNGQFYSSYTCDAYMDCIKNGYKREMIVMGMCGSENMENDCKELTKIVSSGTIGGVFIWEYNLRSEKWEQTIHNIIH